MAMIITAPDRYKSLQRGATYHLLRSCPLRQRVLLVSFEEAQKARGTPWTRRAWLSILTRTDYEAGLVPALQCNEPHLKVQCDPDALPAWLADLKGTSFESDDRFMLPRGTAERSAYDEVLYRRAQIQPALDQLNVILTADDPDRELNRIARQYAPKVNETRFRLWFYSYLAFDQRIWVLLPPRSRCGRWDRQDDAYADSKFGRPSIHLGEMFGARITPDMVAKIVEGYRKYVKRCSTLIATWAMVVRLEFGGKVEKRADGSHVATHPNGSPLPSFDQFRYYVEKHFTHEDRLRLRYGDERYRAEHMGFSGTLIDDIMNTGQRAHLDAQVAKERPKAYLLDGHLPPLRRVDLVDAATGQIQGAGFSLGSETAESYRIALFCAAIPKDRFGRLVGLEIDPADWPSVGLPAEILTDGGPGAAAEVRRSLSPWALAVQQAPAYQPLSNSAAETKHSRRHRKNGAAEFVESGLTAIRLIQRDVLEIIRKNRSDSVRGKAPDRAVVERCVGNPNDLFRWMAERHRTSLIQVSFDEAVRAFLKKVEMLAEDGWLWFRGHRYAAPSAQARDLQHAVRRLRVKTAFTAYVMPLAPLYAWVEHGGRLIEVKAMGDEHDFALFMTEEEAEEVQKARSRVSGRRQANLPLEAMAAQQGFAEATGKEWHSGTTVRGRPKDRTAEKREEVRLMSKSV